MLTRGRRLAKNTPMCIRLYKCHSFSTWILDTSAIFSYENEIIQLFIILSYRNNCAPVSTSRKSGKIKVVLAEQRKFAGMTLLQFSATS